MGITHFEFQKVLPDHCAGIIKASYMMGYTWGKEGEKRRMCLQSLDKWYLISPPTIKQMYPMRLHADYRDV